jgi:hypothetical protein
MDATTDFIPLDSTSSSLSSSYNPPPLFTTTAASLSQHPYPKDADTIPYTFVVTADTQFGMTSRNQEWETEMAYSRKAIDAINAMDPRPLFCCVCGDLVDMNADLYAPVEFNTATNNDTSLELQEQRHTMNEIQDAQNQDFQRTWQHLHPDIALVCVCGNHDVGNRPTPTSIQRFRSAFGPDFFSFWVSRCVSWCDRESVPAMSSMRDSSLVYSIWHVYPLTCVLLLLWIMTNQSTFHPWNILLAQSFRLSIHAPYRNNPTHRSNDPMSLC